MTIPQYPQRTRQYLRQKLNSTFRLLLRPHPPPLKLNLNGNYLHYTNYRLFLESFMKSKKISQKLEGEPNAPPQPV